MSYLCVLVLSWTDQFIGDQLSAHIRVHDATSVFSVLVLDPVFGHSVCRCRTMPIKVFVTEEPDIKTKGTMSRCTTSWHNCSINHKEQSISKNNSGGTGLPWHTTGLLWLLKQRPCASAHWKCETHLMPLETINLPCSILTQSITGNN